MQNTVFNTESYQYPQNFADIKPKLERLQQAIKNLEANLIDADSDLTLAMKSELKVDYASELNPNQLLAATIIEGKVWVIAGAGSGKTKTLTYRTSYLLENGVVPKQILLLTFTRKAANEIKSRAKKLLVTTLSDDELSKDILP